MKLRNPRVLRELTSPAANRHISVAELARRAEVSEGFIYHLLNERSRTSPEVASRIALHAGLRREVMFIPSGGEVLPSWWVGDSHG